MAESIRGVRRRLRQPLQIVASIGEANSTEMSSGDLAAIVVKLNGSSFPQTGLFNDLIQMLLEVDLIDVQQLQLAKSSHEVAWLFISLHQIGQMQTLQAFKSQKLL